MAGFVLVMELLPAVARAGPVRSFDQLSKALKAGDTVEVTNFSGRRIRGHVVELTRCSLLVALSSNQRATLTPDAVRKIRRLKPGQTNGVAAAARTCDARDCPPLTVIVVSVASVAHGFGAVFSRGKTVYRAPNEPVSVDTAACRP